LGKYLENRPKLKTNDAIVKLTELTPKKATVIKNSNKIQIDIDDVKIGDTVVILPGERIPIDGIVSAGNTLVDESMLTGESIHVEKGIGDKVFAGCINKNGYIEVECSVSSCETVISQIVEMVEEASGSKAPISRLADKISGIFVPVVIAIAIITFIIWTLAGSGFEFAFSRAICVLVISCPCALGLATPVAVTVGTGVSASNGILIKNAETLEELGRINTILFDKTGTLTKGSPSVTDIIPKESGNDEFLALCASIEQLSEHPLGTAVVKCAKDKALSLMTPESFEAIPGKGLKAVMGGKIYYGGNFSLFEEIVYTRQLLRDDDHRQYVSHVRPHPPGDFHTFAGVELSQ